MENIENKTQKSHKKEEIFKPTLHMIYYWKAFADPYTQPNISATAVKAVEMMEIDGVPKIPQPETLRREVYKWENKKGYKEWSIKNWNKLMVESKPLLDKVGLRRGIRDFRYWEAMQMKYANYKRKSDVTTDDKPINNTDQIANLLLEVLKDGGGTGSKDTKASGGDSQARPSKGEATEDPSI